jgi:hypothetical protein
MLRRAPSVKQFWDSNAQLLSEAWNTWDSARDIEESILDLSLLDSRLRQAIERAWQEPGHEHRVKELWEEVSDGVFQAQFFDPNKLSELRQYLNAAAESGIPTRPPYGIALNRYGAMLDKRSEGYLAAPTFQTFYQALMDKVMRPVARLLFPEITGYDSQTFGFSIHYEPGADTSLQPHTDASSATLNINMNTHDEAFTGSEVDFFNRFTGKVTRVKFEPGVALIHHGNVPHTAHPITSGSRSNMVLWLYGERMQIPSPGLKTGPVTPEERWTVPQQPSDTYAPF